VRKEVHRSLPKREKPVVIKIKPGRRLVPGGMPHKVHSQLAQFGGWMTGLDLRLKLETTDRNIHSAVRDLKQGKLIRSRPAEGLPNGAQEYAVLTTSDDAPIWEGKPRQPAVASTVRDVMRKHGGWLGTDEIVRLIADVHPNLHPSDISGRISWLRRSGQLEHKDRDDGREWKGSRTLYRWIKT
jgi:hypothetical protein